MELIVPTLGESITEATVSKWLKKVGDSFEADEPLVEIETDKITVEVPAPSAGSISEIKVEEGADVNIGGVLALLGDKKSTNGSKQPEKAQTKEPLKVEPEVQKEISTPVNQDKTKLSPSVQKLVDENKLSADKISSSRSDGRLTKEDVFNFMKNTSAKSTSSKEREEIVKMSKIRKTIATRLKESQNTAAILTTFNEVDMSEIMKVRESKKEDFMERYGVKLGFMSFFVKAVVSSLQEFPAVNAEIRDENIIYKNHFDIGIAVGTEKGLVVPVLKNADELSFAEIEKNIKSISEKARDGKLNIEDLQGGTFTISNGGVYGSMLSTPILNLPQSGVLGMHNIIERPTIVDGEIKIRPIMYLALSYDHRIIDGKDSVSFLKTVKENLEDPGKLFLEI